MKIIYLITFAQNDMKTVIIYNTLLYHVHCDQRGWLDSTLCVFY